MLLKVNLLETLICCSDRWKLSPNRLGFRERRWRYRPVTWHQRSASLIQRLVRYHGHRALRPSRWFMEL